MGHSSLRPERDTSRVMKQPLARRREPFLPGTKAFSSRSSCWRRIGLTVGSDPPASRANRAPSLGVDGDGERLSPCIQRLPIPRLWSWGADVHPRQRSPAPKAQPGPALADIVHDRRGQQVRMPPPPRHIFGGRARRQAMEEGGTAQAAWQRPCPYHSPASRIALKPSRSGNLDGDSPKPRGWAITGDGLAAAPVRARRPAGTAHARQGPQPESQARSVHPASPGTGDQSG